VHFDVVETAHILEVGSAVVKRISVDVVAHHTPDGLCDEAVHQDEVLFAVSAVFSDGVFAAKGWFYRPVVTL